MPQAFGQHINAEISANIIDSYNLLDCIRYLQPQNSHDGKNIMASKEEKVLSSLNDIAENIPLTFEIDEVKNKFKLEVSPLNVVLIQEIQRYNVLLEVMNESLNSLRNSLSGLSILSLEQESMVDNI